jgi:hypothetical protein
MKYTTISIRTRSKETLKTVTRPRIGEKGEEVQEGGYVDLSTMHVQV